ncbi:T9SS type A sorting domain-containing protein [Candidatus Neomarinimicrobiota bacterium]
MKRMLTVLSLGITIALGQTITPIADIQYVADPGTDDASPLDGTVVTVSGVVTAEYWGTYKNRTMYIQDADSAWSGIYGYKYGDDGWHEIATFDPGVGRTTVVEGDSVTITATVDEYYGVTELVDATSLIVHGKALNPPAPILLTPGEANAEKYEGVLVRIEDVTVADPDLGSGEWSFTDGTDTLGTNDDWPYYYYPTEGAGIASITGVMTYSYGAYKILPRLAMDVDEAGPYIRVQAIQQVRGSALYMLPDSMGTYDYSYFLGDTVSCLAIVTVPDRELSGWDTTGGVLSGYSRFIWQDAHGGPWSSILSYFADATAFPELFVGDSISITGYIFEYHGAGMDAAFTEMFITEPVSILAAGARHPDTTVVTTGELREPITAEQWENNIIRIENATVIDNNLPNYEYSIDDGSGVILTDGDATNSMYGTDVYGNPLPEGGFIRPPNGTTIKSITGYCYHAYGSFENNDTYQIRPVVPSDVILGGGPPSITGFTVTESALGPADAVTVSATMTDKSDVASAVVTYRVDGGAWTEVAMTEGTDSLWTGIIPATTVDGAFVEYFLKGTDDGGDNQDTPLFTFLPPDTSKGMYGYHTRTGANTIHDIQYTPYSSGDSYYAGQIVSVTGVVTSNAQQPTSKHGGFVIQDGSGIWNGVLATLGTATYTVTQGDSITITGEVYERYNETRITDVSAVTVHSTGHSVVPLEVTGTELGELGTTDPSLEKYEHVLLHVGEVTVVDSGNYDRDVSDDAGVTFFMLDDDFMVQDVDDDLVFNDLGVGDVISDLTGIWTFTYGNYVLMMRDVGDLGIVTSVADGNGIPETFSLSQNYPNPFNPSTTIEYSLGSHVKHTLKIYNLRGALVATLVNDVRPAGNYSVTWNARDFASGMYFLRLDAADFHMTKKLILLK